MKNIVSSCRKIVAVGRNYAKHAAELNNPVPSKPILFLKPASSFLLRGQGNIEIPSGCTNLHHEVELGVVIGRDGRDISRDQAMEYVQGYFLALDMTARELQSDAKKKGLPWSVCKGYDTFTPVSDFIPKSEIKDPHDLTLWCKVDDVVRQEGKTSDMIFDIPGLISYISTIFTLNEGDTIITGTPEGVGPVHHGSTISAGISGLSLSEISFKVANRELPSAL